MEVWRRVELVTRIMLIESIAFYISIRILLDISPQYPRYTTVFPTARQLQIFPVSLYIHALLLFAYPSWILLLGASVSRYAAVIVIYGSVSSRPCGGRYHTLHKSAQFSIEPKAQLSESSHMYFTSQFICPHFRGNTAGI